MSIDPRTAEEILSRISEVKDPAEILDLIGEAGRKSGVDLFALYRNIEKARRPNETLEQAFKRVVVESRIQSNKQ